MKKELLMSFDDYNKLEHPVPYTYVLNKGTQYIYYFGSQHSFDPDDEQFIAIEKMWNEFAAKTAGQKRYAVLEGGNRPALETREKAILEGGEMHFVAFLAKRDGVPTFSPEPPEAFRFSETLKYFSKEEIAYYDFARICFQWNRKKVKPDFDEYLGRFLKANKQDSGWNDFDFTIEHLTAIHKKLFNRDFNKDDKQFFYDVINPTTDFSVINKVSRFEDSGFRDYYILGEIEKYWKQGNSLFITYGCSHAVMHEAVLRDIVG